MEINNISKHIKKSYKMKERKGEGMRGARWCVGGVGGVTLRKLWMFGLVKTSEKNSQKKKREREREKEKEKEKERKRKIEREKEIERKNENL